MLKTIDMPDRKRATIPKIARDYEATRNKTMEAPIATPPRPVINKR
jgi:hypothetical protein